jgi:hypothetical protein
MGRRRRTQIGGQVAPRLIEMLESPAYRALSLSGHRVLDRIEIEMAHHGGTDNGKLPVKRLVARFPVDTREGEGL